VSGPGLLFPKSVRTGPGDPFPRKCPDRTRRSAATECDRTGPAGPLPRKCPDLTCPGLPSTCRLGRFSNLANDLRSVVDIRSSVTASCPACFRKRPDPSGPGPEQVSGPSGPDQVSGPGSGKGTGRFPSASGASVRTFESGPVSPDQRHRRRKVVARALARGVFPRGTPPARSRSAAAQRVQTSFCHKRPDHQDQISTRTAVPAGGRSVNFCGRRRVWGPGWRAGLWLKRSWRRFVRIGLKSFARRLSHDEANRSQPQRFPVDALKPTRYKIAFAGPRGSAALLDFP
jgi:hypothetical protein